VTGLVGGRELFGGERRGRDGTTVRASGACGLVRLWRRQRTTAPPARRDEVTGIMTVDRYLFRSKVPDHDDADGEIAGRIG
jgi:hypothetical protein